MTISVRKGLFRTDLPGIGVCARVDMRAGDAAPYLERAMYEILGFESAFDTLPQMISPQLANAELKRVTS